MTWVVSSRKTGVTIHQSDSFEGAQRWVNSCFLMEHAEFHHTSSILTTENAQILFRIFLKETRYRQGKVKAKYVADAFNDWLLKQHGDTESISTRRMVGILNVWGADVERNRSGVFEYYLNRRHVCDHCGARKHFDGNESVCSFCGRTEVFE